LIEKWRAAGLAHQRAGRTEQAALYFQLADEMERGIQAWLDEVLPITRAASTGGYGRHTLREHTSTSNGTPLVPVTWLDNRSKGIRRGDIPRKPGFPLNW